MANRYRCADRMCGADDCDTCYPGHEADAAADRLSDLEAAQRELREAQEKIRELTEDTAKLKALVREAYEEGWSSGHHEGIGDGHPLGGRQTKFADGEWEYSDAHASLSEMEPA